MQIKDIEPAEFPLLGALMVRVYSELPGFPGPEEQPGYYRLLENIGAFSQQPDTQVLVAWSAEGDLLGGVVYFGDMARYGSGGRAPLELSASGIRLLGVDPAARGQGVGKALSRACMALAREHGNRQVILHTTEAMQAAWGMYLKLGFVRAPELDFLQLQLQVYGFRHHLPPATGGHYLHVESYRKR